MIDSLYAFPGSPDNLMAEVQSAIEATRDALCSLDSMVMQYAGRHYEKWRGHTQDEEAPENHYFEWISYVLPQVAYANPIFRATTKRMGETWLDAVALQHGLNRWTRENNLRDFLVEGPLLWMQFAYGVALLSEEAIPGARPIEGLDVNGGAVMPHWPRVYDIHPRRYFEDPLAASQSQPRYRGHIWVRDKWELTRHAEANPDEGWNLEALEQLTKEVDERDLGRMREHDVERHEATGYTVWVPEHRLEDAGSPDDGFHGTIFTLPGKPGASAGATAGATDTNKLEGITWLRKPYPYWGPPTGPYYVFGIYSVPGKSKPLGPLTAVNEQIRELNRFAQAVSRANHAYKRMVFVVNGDNKLVQLVKSGQADYVFNVSLDPDTRVEQVEVGGATEQQYTQVAFLRDRVQRVSGLSDAQRGNVTGRGTATENTIADKANDIRLAWIKEQATKATAQLAWGVGWYLWYNTKTAFPLGPEVAKELGLPELLPVLGENGQPLEDPDLPGVPLVFRPEPWYRGGAKARRPGSYDDIELTIEPYSMERADPAQMQRNAAFLMELGPTVAPIIAATPWFGWRKVFKFVGEALNLPELDDVIDEELAMQFAQLSPELAGSEPKKYAPRLVGKGAPPAIGIRAQAKASAARNMGLPVPQTQRGGVAGPAARPASQMAIGGGR